MPTFTDLPPPVVGTTPAPMIAFTISSNSHLAEACVLGESLLRHNPGASFVIGLVDLPDATIDYASLGPFAIVPVHEIRIPDFEAMTLRYSPIELFTAVKPFFFRHLFQKHANDEGTIICYFDSDFKIYHPLAVVEQALKTHHLMLTPHILSPIPLDGQWPAENGFLKYGLYNLGFCAMRAGREADRVIDWWCERLVRHCRIDERDGLFLDQLWMNLAPLFFEGVEVCRHPGLNVAYWNLHERRLQCRDDAWYVNEHWPLVFYHFSSFPIEESEIIGRSSNTRFSTKNRPEMIPLLTEYRAELLRHDTPRFQRIPCAYSTRNDLRTASRRGWWIVEKPLRSGVRLLKRMLPARLIRFVKMA
jgi:hypothetical protein